MWIVTVRPFVMPTEARETLERLRFNKSPETVLDETWDARGEAEPAKSIGSWPFKYPEMALPTLYEQSLSKSPSNVSVIKRGGK